MLPFGIIGMIGHWGSGRFPGQVRPGAGPDRGQPQHVEDFLGAQVGTGGETSDEVLDHVPLSSCSKISASCARAALSGAESPVTR